MLTTKPDPPTEVCAELNHLPKLIVKLLWQRGITTKIEARKFLEPSLDDLYDPFLLKDMRIARERIVSAVKQKEKIAIFGDFDADGITSTVVMVELLEKMNHRDVAVYTPDRFKRGEYGLTFAVAEKIIQGGSRLLIIIDSGMNNHAQIEAVAQKGIEVIIIDHHQVISGRPRAIAVVNPYQSGEQYPFKDLSSCGLVLKLSQALLNTISVPFVELAAIAAVEDR